MNVAEAWASGRPIWSRTPGINGLYSESELVDWLTGYWDELLIDTKAKIDAIPTKQLNPLLCDIEWLDYLAPLFGWDKKHWNPQWSVATKRILLANSYSGQSIWESKGTASTLSFVLTAIGIKNQVVVDGDFIIGVSTVGSEIGSNPWEYTIYLPPEYELTDKQRETIRIDSLFGPAWCQRQIVFDAGRFVVYQLLSDGSSALSNEGGLVLSTVENSDSFPTLWTESGDTILTENGEVLRGG